MFVCENDQQNLKVSMRQVRLVQRTDQKLPRVVSSPCEECEGAGPKQILRFVCPRLPLGWRRPCQR